ncbi:DUF1461 domain-containing protein [Candidatus Woesearchaeota archaeon]|nr:DUF1461 domain-containing protein [Candidatus Woesearchaeota archaeon]
MILLGPLFCNLYNNNFYYRQYEKNNAFNELGEEKTKNITGNLFGFFQDKEELNYFNEKEQSHLIDVKNLFFKLRLVYAMSMFLFLISSFGLYFLYRNNLKELKAKISKAFMYSSGFVIFFIILLFLLSRINFSGFWMLLHKILFTGNYLFPEDSLLITLFPESFFISFGFLILGISFVVSAVLMLFLVILLLNRSK